MTQTQVLLTLGETTSSSIIDRFFSPLIYFSVVFVFTQFMSRCFGRAVSLVLRGICVRFVWEAPATLQPNAVLTTTMSVTMATWEL